MKILIRHKFSTTAFLLMAAMLSVLAGFSSDTGRIPAFPGAEGHGRYVTGGRSGRVIYVTNLNDDNSPGSLRYAINQSGARTILFKVSGTIQLRSNLTISNGDVTIAGQTAPGDGITIRDYTVRINADNVILRFLRFRMGDETNQENDAIWGRDRKDIIIDHCSISWGTDELASFYDNENFTMQWCILSESLRNSVHNKGLHGYGGIWGGRNASFHHNLLANNDSRNPRFCGSRYSNQPTLELVDFRNNTLYNWGSNSAYAAEGGRYNIVNNYYQAGPATTSNRSRILQPYADDGSNSQPRGTFGTFYITGNLVTASAANTSNNWLGVSLHSSFGSYAPGITLNDLKADVEFNTSEVTTHTAQTAYEKVLRYAGASLKRDTIDKRILRDVSTGTATCTDGGNGSTNGLIDTQRATGGWPELTATAAPADSDNDGMPDHWEEANRLDKFNAADALLTTIDGSYPNLEVYLNSLVEEIIRSSLEDAVVSNTPPVITPEKEPEVVFHPATGRIQIRHTSRMQLIRVYSVTGALLTAKSVKDYSAELEIREKGIVILQIFDDKNRRYSKKLPVFR